MGKLYMMTTIVDRKALPSYVKVFQENDLSVMFFSLGYGTATNEILSFLGLSSNEKAIAYCIVEESKWKSVKKEMQNKLKIDAPGGGISFIIPLSSIGGKTTLQFLLNQKEYQKEEESTLKATERELIIAIAEHGYNEQVMEAAKKGGAYGGTVIHAKGTGMEAAEKFMGIHLASEKEVIYIVAKTSQKNAIMQSIMEHAGPATKAKAICFSLPVTGTAGLRLMDEEE